MKLIRLPGNKLFISFFFSIFFIMIILLLAAHNSIKTEIPSVLPLQKINSLNPSEVKSDVVLVQVNSLYEIGDNEPVITAVIVDKKPLVKDFPFLNRAYKDDLIITTPKKTIIFSPSTKSIRDISTISVYEKLKKMLVEKP